MGMQERLKPIFEQHHSKQQSQQNAVGQYMEQVAQFRKGFEETKNSVIRPAMEETKACLEAQACEAVVKDGQGDITLSFSTAPPEPRKNSVKFICHDQKLTVQMQAERFCDMTTGLPQRDYARSFSLKHCTKDNVEALLAAVVDGTFK